METNPITEYQQNILEEVREATFYEELALLSVNFRGKPKAAIVRVRQRNEEYSIYPLAIILDEDDLLEIRSPDGELPGEI